MTWQEALRRTNRAIDKGADGSGEQNELSTAEVQVVAGAPVFHLEGGTEMPTAEVCPQAPTIGIPVAWRAGASG